jgi:hypothetical protein
MAVISGGNVITGGVVMPNTGPRVLRGSGAPVAGTTYSGTVAAGDLYVDDANNNVYEYTAPGGTPTYTRIDTV